MKILVRWTSDYETVILSIFDSTGSTTHEKKE